MFEPFICLDVITAPGIQPHVMITLPAHLADKLGTNVLRKPITRKRAMALIKELADVTDA